MIGKPGKKGQLMFGKFNLIPSCPTTVCTFQNGQVRLIRLVRLQTDNFPLFLRQLMDKRKIFICKMSKR
jgi:hypothetical protein